MRTNRAPGEARLPPYDKPVPFLGIAQRWALVLFKTLYVFLRIWDNDVKRRVSVVNNEPVLGQFNSMRRPVHVPSG
jgi:hypothetical protein